MGCLLVLGAFFSPRLVLFLLFLFTDRLSIAFNSFWIGLAGFLFLPWATTLFAVAYDPIDGVTGIGWLLVALGLLADLSSWFGGGRHAQSRRD
ncbi:MAG: hypothetical protein QOJ69_282 [Actinomycetota bacterium]|nr:hypothetical protein [Actinomycetota bacterium]